MVRDGLSGPKLQLDYEVRIERIDHRRARIEWRVVPGSWQSAGIYDLGDPHQPTITVVCPASIELSREWRVTG